MRDPLIEADEIVRYRRATQIGRLLGSNAFVGKLEARLQRHLKRLKTGPTKRMRAASVG